VSWVLDGKVLAVIAALVLVSSVFALVEPFSELGLLGPGGKIGDYPREVEAGAPFSLNVYVGNHEGKTVYYRVLVKLGDNSSVINGTVPLAAEPILDVRAILSHNSSKTIPVNLTLYEPAVRLRLVFEMWIFNESAGGFSYYGRWNQLWLNVTASSFEGGIFPSRALLSRRMENRLVEGYMAVRRAEMAGGNVSEMVGLLNEALRLAQGGDEASAESLIGQVLAMEPEVSRRGSEASRIRLYTDVGAVSAVLAVGVGGFIYFRHRVWIYWARLRRDWRIVWTGNSVKLNSLEKAIRDNVKSSSEVSVENLVFNPGLGYRVHEVARALYRLARNGALRLVDPDPPRSFGDYFLSAYNMGFALAAFLVAGCLFSVYGSGFAPGLAVLRMVLGSLFTLFLPGYSLIEALYPRGDEISPLERLALSLGLSLALVPLVGLLLNYTPWGIRLDPVMAALSMLTLALLLVSAYRKYGLLRLKRAALGRGG